MNTRQTYRGYEITRNAFGWYCAYVLSPNTGPWGGRYYVNVKAETVHGCRRAIADVLNGSSAW